MEGAGRELRGPLFWAWKGTEEICVGEGEKYRENCVYLRMRNAAAGFFFGGGVFNVLNIKR